MLPNLTQAAVACNEAAQAVKDNCLWTGLRRLSNFRAAAFTNSLTRRDLLSDRTAKFVMRRNRPRQAAAW